MARYEAVVVPFRRVRLCVCINHTNHIGLCVFLDSYNVDVYTIRWGYKLNGHWTVYAYDESSSFKCQLSRDRWLVWPHELF